MTQFIKKLPAVFQTVTEKKFFDATFDQVFTKKDSDLLYGYIGRRQPGRYHPISDFYLPEPTKDRTWWQLEATAFARNEDTSKSNVFFYDDLLNRIKYYGGNVDNQDRLTESNYYSWAPPIDFDMFVNYQNYYWVEQGLPTITITGVQASSIIGKSSYTTPSTATPPNLKLSTGMNIILASDPNYNTPHIVEFMGGCTGIRLVKPYTDVTSGTIFEFLPWDGVIELGNGRVIRNTIWDTQTWDVQAQPGNADYITIQRGSLDRNAWSRTNKWFHLETISEVCAITNTPFPTNTSRALRPIIQFIADLILFNSGTNFRSEIQYGIFDGQQGAPIALSSLQGQQVSVVNGALGINIVDGDIVVFFGDNTNSGFSQYAVKNYLYRTEVSNTDAVTFVPLTEGSNPPRPLLPGDIVFATADAPWNGAKRGQTWYLLESGLWLLVQNDKVGVNQAPLFQLFDHNNVPLNDVATYPDSTFNGSKIFSYKTDNTPGARVDPVLRFPVVYTSLGQASDILFQNNLITDRYTYTYDKLPINGYYYYSGLKQITQSGSAVVVQDDIIENSWNLYDPCPCDDIAPPTPCNCIDKSKQRVIDRYVVGYGTQYQFKLSVTPYGYPANPDLIVTVNGLEIQNSNKQTNGYTFETINNRLYVNLEDYLNNLFTVTQAQPPVVEIQTYTWDDLDPEERGYYEIPQQLEANPTNNEVSEISGSNLNEQFSSIIANQIGFVGSAFGGINNYRDSRKNRSTGKFILQNVSPLLKSMLVSSSDDLDLIQSIRFSQDEYTKFKNRFLKTAKTFIDQEFSPVQYHNNTIIVSAWTSEILKTINVSKEFSNAFAYSYMLGWGNQFAYETRTVPASGTITLYNYIDLSDPKNAVYFYDITGQERILTIGVDYEFVSTNLSIEVRFIPNGTLNVGDSVYVAMYKNAQPAYIPSTPTKLGLAPCYIPKKVLDTSYTIPTEVIIGHDGSKMIAYGDYRDDLLLDLETRIYNLISFKFRNEYTPCIDIKYSTPGYFRKTRYSREQYLAVTESYLNKWSTKNKVNYRTNEWAEFSQSTPTNQLWKLYNYTDAVSATTSKKLNLPGNWKGIYLYYYDTIDPAGKPWEIQGFSEKPVWWEEEYGPAPYTNTSAAAHNMWQDIEAGIIRQGPSAVYDPVTLLPVPQPTIARPGITSNIPVDNAGNIIPVPQLFNVAMSGNNYEPFDGFDKDWVFGDVGPVEAAWMSTSSYQFCVQEFMYLLRPANYGELAWDTLGIQMSPGALDVPNIVGPVKSSTNWQYVQNEMYPSDDLFAAWMRPKNKNQIVHAESIDNEIQIRFGYQRWVSDRLLFLGKDITSTFGQKIRTLDINLANKLAGFTNKDTTNMYIESANPNTTTANLLIPSTNFDVLMHKGQPIKTYTYSGVVIRALGDGTFVVYGYDLLTSEFVILERATTTQIDVTVGGTPEEFRYYAIGETYNAGEIARYNGVYYRSLVTQVTGSKFDPESWTKLRALPITDGISVSYKPDTTGKLIKVAYGTVLNSVQEVFDLLIGWGEYLKSQGWKFDEVSTDTNQISDWLYCGKQFLFWLNSSWAPDAAIQLSPLSNKATLEVEQGYPDDVEKISNGVYSILDKYGVAIPTTKTSVERDGRSISVIPTDTSGGGIYFLLVNASETEHILIFDNVTNFNDVIYDPLLRARQQRLRFNGFRSNGWFGKMEAPGYLIMDNELVPNYDTIVEAMRYYYDPNVTIDNPSLEDLGRHLIGYESKSYLDNLELTNDVQYLFYQGAIRQKGTVQSFDKLFRSTKIQSNETIEVYEEWALKVADFGNTIEQVSTEFILKPEQNSGEVIVARLNFVPSNIGGIKQINVLNAQNTYSTMPLIVIPEPDIPEDDPRLIEPRRQAKAYAILDSRGVISSVEMVDSGYGYTYGPPITIDAGAQSTQLDILYSVFQGAIIHDEKLDNIVEVDIDDTEKWIKRPVDPSYSLEFPVSEKITYSLPNAGYVNLKDVNYTSFGPVETVINWGTDSFNPTEFDTIWVAKTFTEDWDVYKLANISDSPMAPNPWSIVEDDNGNLLILTPYSNTVAEENLLLLPQLSTEFGARTDFGNIICLQQVTETGEINQDANFAVGFTDNGLYTDPVSLDVYNSYLLVTLDNVPITAEDIPLYDQFTDLLLFKTMRFNTLPDISDLPSYVGIGELIWVDNFNEKWQVMKITPLSKAWDSSFWDASVLQTWSPNYGWDAEGPFVYTPYRVQEDLINTSLFQSATVFDDVTQTQLVQLPVYDPFKSILPAVAKQNVSFISEQDPARYNVTGSTRLFTSNVTFAEAQVGKLWWDTSDIRYVYYEQPLAKDLSETITENLVYRRDYWGELFPGSTARVYEWTKSPVPPAEYEGSGTPKSTTDYVVVSKTNRITNITTTSYYFWVLGVTTLPSVQNRTATALDVQRLLQSPKGQGFAFFAPIQQTETNNSYMFYNVQEILIYKGDNIQIQYRLAEREDQSHTQWKLFREGDPASLISDQFWDKMVDSICGYTRLLPPTDEFVGIPIAKYLPWDIFSWDVTGWDTATSSTTPIYGEVLPVPDPSLSEGEKYGVLYRPRQGMFKDLQMARKIFVQSANALLAYIPIRDDNPSWGEKVTSANYWTYTTWYKEGFENSVPRLVYANLNIAIAEVTSGSIPTGTIIEVTDGTADGRFVMYQVVQSDSNVSVQSLERIAIQDSAIKLLDTIYTVKNIYNLSSELRELLDAFRTQVFIDEFIVDQNELFFSMTNYVLSEQKTPDWIFKSSYIYIKENNLPLSQDSYYVPDQIDNIIDYIKDAKPYHTKIRDYTSTYVTNDLAFGTASDSIKIASTLAFGPTAYGPPGHWDTGAWDNYGWDISPMPEMEPNILDGNVFTSEFEFGYNPLLTANIDQLVSEETIYTVSLTSPDPSKKGYSNLFPYTFSFSSINLNGPQNMITPANVVGVRVGDDILYAEQDFYIERNTNGTFTAYFYEDPSGGDTPEALVWWYGGSLMNIEFNTYRNEVAYGEPSDDMVINVDTKLPVNVVNGNIEPLVGWDAAGWEEMSGNDPVVEEIILANGGSLEIHWDAPVNHILLDNVISFRMNVNLKDGQQFYRNSQRYMGTLVTNIPAPSPANENLDVITVFVDPATHPLGTNILPDPIPNNPGVIWVEGERIEYLEKTFVSLNTWQLSKVRRGSQGTAPIAHSTTVPSLEDPNILVPNPVWVEDNNVFPNGSADNLWNITAPPAGPIPGTETETNKFTSAGPVPVGGLWYGLTDQALFLKEGPKNFTGPVVVDPNNYIIEPGNATSSSGAQLTGVSSVQETSNATDSSTGNTTVSGPGLLDEDHSTPPPPGAALEYTPTFSTAPGEFAFYDGFSGTGPLNSRTVETWTPNPSYPSGYTWNSTSSNTSGGVLNLIYGDNIGVNANSEFNMPTGMFLEFKFNAPDTTSTAVTGFNLGYSSISIVAGGSDGGYTNRIRVDVSGINGYFNTDGSLLPADPADTTGTASASFTLDRYYTDEENDWRNKVIRLECTPTKLILKVDGVILIEKDLRFAIQLFASLSETYSSDFASFAMFISGSTDDISVDYVSVGAL